MNRLTKPDYLGNHRTGLPEDTQYRDDGCPDLGITACVSCPLSRCRYDAGYGSGQARFEMQSHRLGLLLADGLTLVDASQEMGVSLRSVYRLRAKVLGTGRYQRPAPAAAPRGREDRHNAPQSRQDGAGGLLGGLDEESDYPHQRVRRNEGVA